MERLRGGDLGSPKGRMANHSSKDTLRDTPREDEVEGVPAVRGQWDKVTSNPLELKISYLLSKKNFLSFIHAQPQVSTINLIRAEITFHFLAVLRVCGTVTHNITLPNTSKASIRVLAAYTE